MSARRWTPPCGMPWFPHGLKRARFYPCGWRCNEHKPGVQQKSPGQRQLRS